MSRSPAIIPTPGALAPTSDQDLYAMFIAGRSADTRRAYASDMSTFAEFLGYSEARDALTALLGMPYGEANGTVLRFRSSMAEAGLAPATINRRLSAIKSAVKLGRTLGVTAWVPEISGLKSRAYRDTAGPGIEGTRAMLQSVQAAGNARSLRNAAIIRLFFDLALRCAEVVRLDVEDVDVAGRRIWFLGKGRKQKEYRTLPERTLAALSEWIAVREHIAKPEQRAIFLALDRVAMGRRITVRGVHHVIAKIGDDVGLKTWPHGLRHASITAALDRNNGDIRAAQQHARHAKPETTIKYDDNRKDLAGKIANDLSTVL